MIVVFSSVFIKVIPDCWFCITHCLLDYLYS